MRLNRQLLTTIGLSASLAAIPAIARAGPGSGVAVTGGAGGSALYSLHANR